MATKPSAKQAPTPPAAKKAATPSAQPAAAPKPKPTPTAVAPAESKPAPAAQKVVTNIKVDLVVNTEDDLRQIVFGLEKSTDNDGQPKWVIHFKLFKRKDASVDYSTKPRVSLDIVVDKDLHGAAAETAKQGLNTAQESHLRGPIADAAEEGTLPKEDVTDTLGMKEQ